MRFLRAAFIACLVACTPVEEPLPEGFADLLTEQGGCGDFSAYAASADDKYMVRVSGAGLVAAAYAAGEPSSFTFDAIDEQIDVSVTIGRNVSSDECTDYSEGNRTVDTVYRPQAGTVIITITPTGDGDEAWNQTADAIIELTDIELLGSYGREQALPDLTFAASVGWLPG